MFQLTIAIVMSFSLASIAQAQKTKSYPITVDCKKTIDVMVSEGRYAHTFPYLAIKKFLEPCMKWGQPPFFCIGIVYSIMSHLFFFGLPTWCNVCSRPNFFTIFSIHVLFPKGVPFSVARSSACSSFSVCGSFSSRK